MRYCNAGPVLHALAALRPIASGSATLAAFLVLWPTSALAEHGIAARPQILGPLEPSRPLHGRGSVTGMTVKDDREIRDGNATHRVSGAVDQTISSGRLWPDARVPYEIDTEGLDDEAAARFRAVVAEGIAEWNDKTVIDLAPYAGEDDFVRFVPFVRSESLYGRVGGVQQIRIRQPPYRSTVVHEIGHAVGLRHEHQRRDRDRYLTPPDDTIPEYRQRYGCNVVDAPQLGAHPIGPYDHASAMHYGRGFVPDHPYFDTIPPGLLLSFLESNPLSAGDVDTVARLYGETPVETVVDTQPTGLRIVVDGVATTAPARFDWAPGSMHTVEASVNETDADRRLLFGRWSDGGERAHVVVADPDQTWLLASYIAQYSLATATAQGGHTEFHPMSPDGYYTTGTLLQIEAVPKPGYRFRTWGSIDDRERNAGFPPVEGDGTNPAVRAVGIGKAPERNDYWPFFTSEPVLTLKSNAYASLLEMSKSQYGKGTWTVLPTNLTRRGFAAYGVDQNRMWVSVPERVSPWETDYCHRFKAWSDGGDRTRLLQFPSEDRTLELELLTDYPLYAWATGPGTIAMSPAPVDETPCPRPGGVIEHTSPYLPSYFAEGERVTLTATPQESFVGWTRHVYGTDATVTVTMDDVRFAQAVFSDAPKLEPGVVQDVSVAIGGQTPSRLTPSSHVLYVPPDASELTVSASFPDAGGELMLLVNELRPPDMGDGVAVVADFQVRLAGGSATVTIDGLSRPPLAVGAYYVAVVPATSGARPADYAGTIQAHIASGMPIATVAPNALTFVSASGFRADAQSLRLTNTATAAQDYLVDTNRAWLTASPAEGRLGLGETVDISIAVAGGLTVGTHRGELTIRGEPSSETGIAVPVTHVYLNADGTASASVDIRADAFGADIFRLGSTVVFDVDFDRSVSVTGKPRLIVLVGDKPRSAELARVEATGLRFFYQVRPEDKDAEGIRVFGLDLGSATISDADGNDVDVDLGSAVRDLRRVPVDGGQPVRHAVALGDFNGDGKDDILIRDDSGAWHLFLMDGRHLVAGGVVRGVFSSHDWTLQATGDFDGDGKDDILMRHDAGAWHYFAMDGRKVRSGSGSASIFRHLDWELRGTGDFNGDGREDVLLRGQNGSWYYVLMDGRRNIATNCCRVPLTRSAQWRFEGVGDLNGDGNDDVVLRHNDGRWYYYGMAGPPAIVDERGSLPLPREHAWHLVGLGDLNGDGTDDVVLRHADGRWHFHAARYGDVQSEGRELALTRDLNWQAAGIGDLNGDGNDDVLALYPTGRWRYHPMDDGRVIGDQAGDFSLPLLANSDMVRPPASRVIDFSMSGPGS